MNHRRLERRVWIEATVILVVALLLTTYFAANSGTRQSRRNTARALDAIAIAFSSSFADLDTEARASAIDRLRTQTTLQGVDTEWIDAARFMDASVATVGSEPLDPEVESARSTGLGVAERRRPSDGAIARYSAYASGTGKDLNGILRLSVPLASLDSGKDVFIRNLLTGCFITLVLGVWMAFWRMRRTMAPIGATAEFAGRVASGDYDAPMPVRMTADFESTRISDSVATLAAELKRRLETGTRGKRNLDTILQSMVEGIVAVDDEKNIIVMNDVARRLLDVDDEDHSGEALDGVTRQTTLIDAIERVLSSGTTSTTEIRLARIPADAIVDIQVAPMRDQDRVISGAVAVLHDVTAMRKLETMRRDFVANVSHELKTPLTTIQGAAETILDDRSMPIDTLRQFVGRIHFNAERLSILISDLLELSRIQSGAGVLEHKPIELKSIVEDSAARFIDDAESKRLGFEVSTPEESIWVVGDRRALSGVVDNLLSNAIRYTMEGGVVSVSLVVRPKEVDLVIADTGLGIDQQHLERIFERFYRVDTARSRHMGGTGLGLAIVKNGVMAHHGRIVVDSTLGKGSTFTVTLPLARSPDTGESM